MDEMANRAPGGVKKRLEEIQMQITNTKYKVQLRESTRRKGNGRDRKG